MHIETLRYHIQLQNLDIRQTCIMIGLTTISKFYSKVVQHKI
jgi:hypothetical protein